MFILDAGHGGEDGGAVSAKGQKESEINLDIALRLHCLAAFMGVETVLTRDSEILGYPPEAATIAAKKRWDTRQRVELINSVENGFLVSIHQNNYPDSRPRGPQVFYGEVGGSGELAGIMHEQLVAALYPQSRRVIAAADDDIYIMAHAECPAVLVECGFLSHPEEAALLGTDAYRLKIASILLTSCLRYMEDSNESKDDLLLHGVRQ